MNEANVGSFKSRPIGKNLKLTSGFPFPSKFFSTADGFPLIRIRDILSSSVETYYAGTFDPAFVVKNGDVLVGMDGDFNIVRWRNVDALLNQRVLKIEVSDNDEYCLGYVYYWLQPFLKKLNDVTAATTVKHLSTGDLKKAVCLFPDADHQKKIAAILETVDLAIEQTEALIAKYEQVKAGMMQDLFTRGLTAQGKLRPTRQQAPDQYQKTPIGWIPKEWELKAASGVCLKIIDCKNRTPPITADGYPVIRTSNVRNGRFVDQDLNFTDRQSYEIWTARGAPISGDIVITREAPVGEVCAIPKRHADACLGQRMMLYRTDPDKICSEYFLYVLQSESIRNYLDLISGGSTVGHVKVGEIRELPIPKPMTEDEQKSIARTVKQQFAYLESLENDLEKLRQQKSGLMHDLLTGKVAVKV